MLNPGIHVIPASEYHAMRDHLSASVCKTILERSPAHARHQATHEQDDATKASDRGSVAHALLFEGVDMMEILTFDNYRTKLAQEARDGAREAGRYPVLEKDAPAIHAMVNAARKAWGRCPDLQGYGPDDGVCERSLIWSDKGTACRSRPDWFANDQKLIIDGKFTETSAEPEQAARQIIRMAYDQRAAFYCAGAKALTAKDCRYIYLFQEVDPPYCASFVGVSPAMMELGASKVAYAIGKWRECVSSGEWPGYENRVHWAEPPAWALDQWLGGGRAEAQQDESEERGIPYDPARIWGDKRSETA